MMGDTVVSEVHLECDVPGKDACVLSTFEFCPTAPFHTVSLASLKKAASLQFDVDCDFDVPRGPRLSETSSLGDEDEDTLSESWPQLEVSHAVKSTIEQCGLQVWKGALLLCDLTCALDCIRGRTVLELGAGTGLTSLAAVLSGAGAVYATDAPLPSILENCLRNLSHSAHNTAVLASWKGGPDPPPTAVARVRPLNLHVPPDLHRLKDAVYREQLNRGIREELRWTAEDHSRLNEAGPLIILAADVVYEEGLIESLVNSCAFYLHHAPRGTVCFLSIERRVNFTLRDADEVALAFETLLLTLVRKGFALDAGLLAASSKGPELRASMTSPVSRGLTATRIPTSAVPPRFVYERGRQLELVLLEKS